MNLLNVPFVEAMGRRSLAEIFDPDGPAVANLTGSGADVVITMKFLLAICQSAIDDEADPAALTSRALAEAVTGYLADHRDEFELTGDRPFLQYPEAAHAAPRPLSIFLPGRAGSVNRGIVRAAELCDAPDAGDCVKALLAAVIMPLSGKKTDATVRISSEDGRRKGFAAPAVGPFGLLHAFVWGRTLLDTLRLNLLTEADLKGSDFKSIGTAPWEEKPLEVGPAAARLRSSLMGRLVPMARFVLLDEDGRTMHVAYGVEPGDGRQAPDPTVTVIGTRGKGAETVNVVARLLDGEHWEGAAAAAGFQVDRGKDGGVQHGPQCLQLAVCLPRAAGDAAWRGVLVAGVRVASQSGEQYVSGAADGSYRFFFNAAGGEKDMLRRLEFMRRLDQAVYAVVASLAAAAGLGTRAEAMRGVVCGGLIEGFSELMAAAPEDVQRCARTLVRDVNARLKVLLEGAGSRTTTVSGGLLIDAQPLMQIFDSTEEQGENHED